MDKPNGSDRRAFLRHLFDVAVATARPEVCVPRFLPKQPAGRLIVTGAGKAAAAMTLALEANWQGALTGAVVTRHGYALPTETVEVLEAGHPVPDAASESAARRMLDLATSAGPDDLVLFLGAPVLGHRSGRCVELAFDVLDDALVDEGASDQRFGFALRKLEFRVLEIEYALAERLAFTHEVQRERDGAFGLDDGGLRNAEPLLGQLLHQLHEPLPFVFAKPIFLRYPAIVEE